MSPSQKHGESWAKPNLYGWMKFGPFYCPSELDQRSLLFSLRSMMGGMSWLIEWTVKKKKKKVLHASTKK